MKERSIYGGLAEASPIDGRVLREELATRRSLPAIAATTEPLNGLSQAGSLLTTTAKPVAPTGTVVIREGKPYFAR